MNTNRNLSSDTDSGKELSQALLGNNTTHTNSGYTNIPLSEHADVENQNTRQTTPYCGAAKWNDCGMDEQATQLEILILRSIVVLLG